MRWRSFAIRTVLFAAWGCVVHGVTIGPPIELQDDSRLLLREASEALREGRWARALRTAESVLATDGANPSAHGIMGTVFALENRRSEAVASMEVVEAANPGAYEARLIRAILLAQDGEVASARTALEGLVREDRDHPVPLFYLASIQFALDERELARTAFRDLLARHERFAPAWAGLGDLARKAEKGEEAISAYREALKLDPDNAAYRRQLISLYDATGNTEARDEQIKRLVRRVAGVKELHLRNGMRLLLQGAYKEALEVADKGLADHEEFADGHYIRAASLASLGRAEEARASIKAYLDARPRSPQARYYAGMCFMAMDSWDEAREAFATAAGMMPSFRRSMANQAVIAQITGEHERAAELLAESNLATEAPGLFHFLAGHGHLARGDRETYQTAMRNAAVLLPDSGQVDGLADLPDRADWPGLARERNLMILFYMNAWYGRAIRSCESILDRRPEDVLALFFWSECLKNQMNQEEAGKVLQRVAGTQTRWTHPWLELGRMHLAGGESGPAAGAFAQAIKRDPRCVEAYLGLGRCHEMREDFASSEKACLKAVALDPGHPAAQLQLAWNYLEHLDRPEDAERAARRGVDLDPRNPAGLDLLGRILLRAERAAQAVEVLGQATLLAPADPVIRYHLGLAQHQEGQLSDARDSLGQALQLSPRFPGAEQAKALRDEITGTLSQP